jgi:D-alanyl-D-alanine carboxypeptidase
LLADLRDSSTQATCPVRINTKTFVIIVLLQLVDEGGLRLDDPLSRFLLGVTIPNAHHITLRQVCEMRSGLFEAYDMPEFERMNPTPKTVFDPHTLVRWAVKQKPYFSPGKGYRYSNTSYLILGLIIKGVTKDKVGSQIRKRRLCHFV